MKAVKLRLILSGIIVLLFVATGGGFYVLSQLLTAMEVTADHARIDADLSSSDSNRLNQLSEQLDKQKDVVAKAQKIVGTQADYKYQDEFINDINQLARTFGVTITGFSFPDPNSVTSSNAVKVLTVLPSGVKPVLITINLKGPVSYQVYLRFLRGLELNLTRLQITGINLSPDSANPTQISNPSIGIEIFVRQ